MTRFERIILFAYCLNVVDVILTVHLTAQMGMIELNPIMAWLLALGPGFFAVFKLAVMGVLCEIFRRRHKGHEEMTGFALGVVVGMFLMICAWQINLSLWAANHGPMILDR